MKMSLKILQTRRSGDLKGQIISDILFGDENPKDLTQVVKSKECKTRDELDKKTWWVNV